MRNWPEHLASLCIFVILVCLVLLFYGQTNSARLARCDDPEFAKHSENVEYCQAVKIEH